MHIAEYFYLVYYVPTISNPRGGTISRIMHRTENFLSFSRSILQTVGLQDAVAMIFLARYADSRAGAVIHWPTRGEVTTIGGPIHNRAVTHGDAGAFMLPTARQYKLAAGRSHPLLGSLRRLR